MIRRILIIPFFLLALILVISVALYSVFEWALTEQDNSSEYFENLLFWIRSIIIKLFS